MVLTLCTTYYLRNLIMKITNYLMVIASTILIWTQYSPILMIIHWNLNFIRRVRSILSFHCTSRVLQTLIHIMINRLELLISLHYRVFWFLIYSVVLMLTYTILSFISVKLTDITCCMLPNYSCSSELDVEGIINSTSIGLPCAVKFLIFYDLIPL